MLLRLINMTDLGSLDRFVSSPSYDLVKSVEGFTIMPIVPASH